MSISQQQQKVQTPAGGAKEISPVQIDELASAFQKHVMEDEMAATDTAPINPAELPSSPNVALANQIVYLTTKFKETKDASHLKEIMTILELIDSDLTHRPPPENPGLRLFAEAHSELSIEQARQVVVDVERVWPEVKDVTCDRIMLLKRGLLDDKLFLPYKKLRPFIAVGCRMLAAAETEGNSTTGIAAEDLETVAPANAIVEDMDADTGETLIVVMANRARGVDFMDRKII
ncbi:hypothetical protein G7Y89_g5601 [Cudoniella acicularis]|uniref:Uncharacterized protein n=1 Tax=Cudoniella acicularis TaxID=354080 RepID=A0A8H4W386_9HELO|nr:hypothetical protein G7Y89_g5601 [Cudoniella acicularis]